MDQYWGYLISALLGFIFGFVPLVIFENYKEHRTRRRIALVIDLEIKSLFELAKDKGWISFLKGDQVNMGDYIPPITFDYFRVYDSNLELIALLELKLMQDIVNFYNKTKGIVRGCENSC